VRLLSLLKLNLISNVTGGSADLVPPLVQALSDREAEIASRAAAAVASLRNSMSVDMLCQMWRESRDPRLEEIIRLASYVAQRPPAARVLSALKNNRMDVIMQSSADMVSELVEACADQDPEIAARAVQCLPHLQNQAAVDVFCQIWSFSRDALLEKALVQAGYHARGEPEIRLLVALKTGQKETARRTPPQALPFLFKALEDADEVIREHALDTLLHLTKEETRDALCAQVVLGDLPAAREIALKAGYAPRAPEDRALFFFITEQWQAYDALDFDQTLLRAIYEGSPETMRKRIADQVLAAGRTPYLTILAGVDFRARAETVTSSESALMIRVLAQNNEYARMWSLVPELALSFSQEIIRLLAQSSWQPEEEADRPFFAELVQLAHQPVMLTGPELSAALPPAIARSTLKVKGRVNEVAFSPNRPVLAIATSQRKVVLWNFHTATIEQVLTNFQHSVGKVSFTPGGWLLGAERSSTRAMCSVSVFNGTDDFILHAHEGTVTVLAPIGEDQLLTAGRDQRVFVWDLKQQRKISEKDFPFWARSAAIAPDMQSAALLHDRLTLVRIPGLANIPGYPFLMPRVGPFVRGVAQNAVFSPDGKFLLAGQYNGQVGLYYHTSLTQRPKSSVLTQHSQPVRGIHFLPNHPIVVSAGGEGLVRFTGWPEMKPRGSVASPDGRLTSLRVSNNGAFMATGSNEASLVLWDLRVLDIPDLFSQPLATANHDQISNVMALSEYGSLPEPVRNGLRFLRAILQYRFRYDIQIDEAPTIQFGEFDIILEDAS
jgi:HEAT repeat protein